MRVARKVVLETNKVSYKSKIIKSHIKANSVMQNDLGAERNRIVTEIISWVSVGKICQATVGSPIANAQSPVPLGSPIANA